MIKEGIGWFVEGSKLRCKFVGGCRPLMRVGIEVREVHTTVGGDEFDGSLV
jgi:hypothetical protein